MKVSFVGSKEGMSHAQKNTLRWLLGNHYDQIDEFHHGDSYGADNEADDIVRETRLCYCTIVLHPSRVDYLRANTDAKPWLEGQPKLQVIVLREKPQVTRNCELAEQADIVIVTPKTREYQKYSDAWVVYSHAMRLKKRVILIYPDGKFNEYNGPPSGVFPVQN